MINFNFLGLGSFTSAQQKGKANGATAIELGNSTVLVDGELPVGDAAFPDVLMQILLGQQIPITLPGVKEQSSGETIIGTELFVSDQPKSLDGQSISLREQLFAGEMKKQTVIQKSEMQKTGLSESKITLDLANNTEISKILAEGSELESDNPSQQFQKEEAEAAQLIISANSVVEGMNIGSSPLQSNLKQPNQTKPNDAGKNNIGIDGSKTISKNGQLPMLIDDNINSALNGVQSETKQTIKQALVEKQDVSGSKSMLQSNNLFTNEIIQSDFDEALAIPSVEHSVKNKEIQSNEIASKNLPKTEKKPFSEELTSQGTSKSLKNPIVIDEIGKRSAVLESKKTIHTTINKEQDFVSITSNDFQQKGILSAIVTQNGKSVKPNNLEASTIDKSNSLEKQSTAAATGSIEPSVNIPQNETQNSGNRSSMQKENFEQQLSSDKNIASVDARQGQQAFVSVIEEKNSTSVTKTQQTEVASLLRQQDTVNNIFDQLAKNVKVSIDENNSQIKISLKPEALGEVMLKVTIEHGKVSTQMEVQQPQVKTVIEANLQVLRESLSSKGLVVDRIDISTAQYSLNEKSSQQGQQRPTSKNYFGKEIAEEEIEQTKLYGYNTVDYVA